MQPRTHLAVQDQFFETGQDFLHLRVVTVRGRIPFVALEL
jgi:hypothetical protein